MNGDRIKMRKWTVESAKEYIRKAKEKGLKFWSAMDYLKKHRNSKY